MPCILLLLLDLDNDDDKDEAREPVNRCASEMATVLGTVLGASVKNGNLAMLAAMFGAIGNGTMLGAMLDANMKNGNLAMLAAVIAPETTYCTTAYINQERINDRSVARITQ